MNVTRIVRFLDPALNSPAYGIIEGEAVRKLGETFDSVAHTAPLNETAAYGLVGLKSPPPISPTKIVCVGRNYVEHALELGNEVPDEPLIFLKPPSAIVGEKETIILPQGSERVEYEGEVGVAIGRKATRLSAHENPSDYVLGDTCLNDVTARDIQRKEAHFTRARSFDTFYPVGPFIAKGLDPLDLKLQTRVNGRRRQHASTPQMKFSNAFFIRFISNIMTLNPGDLIATGNPAGVGALHDQDVVEVEIEHLGVLVNPVSLHRPPVI